MRPGTIQRLIITKPLLEKYIQPAQIILDIGGFDGVISCQFSEDCQVLVLDLDPSGLKVAQANGAESICASGLFSPILDSSIGIVFMFDLLSSLSASEREVLVTEVARIIKPGGLVIFTDVDGKFNLPFTDREKMHQSWRTVSGLDLKEIHNLFKDNKFAILEQVQYYSYVTRLFYAIFFFWNFPQRGSNLKRVVFKQVIKFEKIWCPNPLARCVVAKASK